MLFFEIFSFKVHCELINSPVTFNFLFNEFYVHDLILFVPNGRTGVWPIIIADTIVTEGMSMIVWNFMNEQTMELF